MSILVRPDTRSELLRSKLSRGLGHNSYGEQAWPNDLLYMFPISILGTFVAVIGLATLAPTPIGEPANPYATPYEILPEWFLFPTDFMWRAITNKLLGITAIAAVPLLLMGGRRGISESRFQNPVRRPIASLILLDSTFSRYFWVVTPPEHSKFTTFCIS